MGERFFTVYECLDCVYTLTTWKVKIKSILIKRVNLQKTNLRRNRKPYIIQKPFKKLNQHFKIPFHNDTTTPSPESSLGKFFKSREERYQMSVCMWCMCVCTSVILADVASRGLHDKVPFEQKPEKHGSQWWRHMNISERRDSKYEGLEARKFWECSRKNKEASVHWKDCRWSQRHFRGPDLIGPLSPF